MRGRAEVLRIAGERLRASAPVDDLGSGTHGQLVDAETHRSHPRWTWWMGRNQGEELRVVC